MTDSHGWRDNYLTVAWNNIFTAMLGLPAVLYGGFALYTSALSDRAAFLGMVAIGAVY